MAPPISRDVRLRIVHWREEEGRSVDEIASLSGRSKSSIHEILELHRPWGTVVNPLARRTGRCRALDPNDMNFINGLVSARPTIHLDEIRDQLAERRDVFVSVATISRTLSRMNLTRELVSPEVVESKEMTRSIWKAHWGDKTAESFLWLGESRVDDATLHQIIGPSLSGHANVQRTDFHRGVNYHILPALTTDGVVTWDISDGYVTKDSFIRFLREEVAPILNPYSGARSIVVMDDSIIHHDEEVHRIVEDECGAKICYLPPDSPDYNPIEDVVSRMKVWLHENGPPVIDARAQPWKIHQAMMSITSDDAWGWIASRGY